MNKAKKADVVVVGAGTAGAICAVAAARQGLKVVLAEQTALVGGVAATALMGSFANLLVSTDFHQLTGGIVMELIARLVGTGGTPYNNLRDAVYGKIGKPFTLPFQPVWYSHVLTEMLVESGVELYLETMLIDAQQSEDTSKRLTFASGVTRFYVEASVVVDATGNADAAYALGANATNAYTNFGCLMRIGGVEFEETIKYINRTRPWFLDSSYEPWLRNKLGIPAEKPIDKCRHLLDPLSYDHAPMKGINDRILTPERYSYIMERWEKEHIVYTLELNLLRNLMRKAADNDDLVLLKRMENGAGITFNGDGISYGAWGNGIVLCNVATAYGFDPCVISDKTKATLEIKKYNVELFRFFKKYVPGFENAELLDMGSQAIARVGRTIKGCDSENHLKNNQLYSQPIYLFGGSYAHHPGVAVPYGKILSENIDNLFAVGKCSSHGGQYRSQISCMSMGIAAAAAAAIICSTGCTSHTMSPHQLETQLLQMGVILTKGVNPHA